MVKADEDFDALFGLLIDEAWELVDLSTNLVYGYLPTAPDVRTPQHTVAWKLQLLAVSRQLSVLHCLRSSVTSEGSYALLRGLLEAWAHLDFLSSGNAGTVRCRDVRWQLGELNDEKALEDKLRAAGATPDQLRPTGYYDAERAQLRAHAGDCRCAKHSGWNDSGVMKVLRTISDQHPMLRWVVAEYGSTSSSVHMYGSHHLLDVDSEGHVTVRWVKPSTRSRWLMWALIAYGRISELAERIMAPGTHGLHEAGFMPRTKALLEDQLLKRAGSDHEFDELRREPSGRAWGEECY